MSSWISVDDRMPEMTCDLFWWESEWVLTYGAQGLQLARLRRLDDDEPSMQPEWIIRGPDGWTCEGVTHWQPITPPQVAANTSILTGGDGCGKPVPPSVPVGVEWPLSVLRAGNWREVHTGRRCMRLEVTYDYAAWERLMEQVEAALAQQPAAVGVKGLPRYGFPDGNEPRPVPCADGYWTPWHLAQQPAADEAKDAEIKALRVDVEAWKASHSLLTDTCHHFQARAKRLEEALREMREYVAAELQGQREAFAGHEHCSDIPGIEADLHKIDTLLREQEEGE